MMMCAEVQFAPCLTLSGEHQHQVLGVYTSGFLPNRSVMANTKPFKKIINIISKCMIIFKMFLNHPKYHFFNICGPFFGPKSGFEEKNCKKKVAWPLSN